MARSVRVAPLNVKKKKVFKGGSNAVSFACKMVKATAFACLANLCNISSWRACRRSEVKGKFVIIRDKGSFHIPLKLRELETPCDQVAKEHCSSLNKKASNQN